MHAAVLRYLDHVARQGSIRKAAETLHVASSAVNRQILRLEAQLGEPIFERRRSGVRLTAAGEVLLRHVRDTQGDFERARAEIAGLRGVVTGEVRIVSIESLLARFLPPVIAEMTARHPQVSFTLLNVDPSHMADELRSGRNDLAVLFVDNQLRGFEVVAEFRTAVGAVMRADHPLARRRQLTLTECADFPVVMLHDRWLLDAVMATEFAESGARLAPRVVSNSIEFMRQIIKSGLGIGFFTPIGFLDEIRRGELVHVRLAERGLANSRIGIVVPSGGRPPSLAARLAIEHIRERLSAFSRELAAPVLHDVATRRRAKATGTPAKTRRAARAP
jgi:DNA-binding transcriptional LysR family regulator